MKHKQKMKSKQRGFIINPFIAAADPFLEKVVLQLDGYGQDFMSPIVDSSTNKRIPNSYGRFYITKKKAYDLNKTSVFAGGNEPLVYSSSADFNLNIDKWTIETFFNVANGNTGNSVCSRRGNGSPLNTGMTFCLDKLRGQVNGVYSDSLVTWTLPSYYEWHHIAYVKNFTTITVFVDGIPVATLNGVNTIADPSATFNIGSAMDTPEQATHCFYQHFRFTKDIARYTSNFTPAGSGKLDNITHDSDFDSLGRDKLLKMAHLQLLGDGSVIEDSSPMNCAISLAGTTVPSISTTRSKWGTQSIYLPLGSSITATSPANKYAFVFLGDYEISMQAYFEGLPAADITFLNLSTSEAANRLTLVRTTTGSFYLSRYGEAISSVMGPAPINQWNHITFGRINGFYFISVNGKVYNFIKVSYGIDGNGTGKLSFSAGGSNTYLNSIRVLPVRNDFDSINAADFSPPVQEFSKTPIPDGYDPLFDRNIFLCPFDSFSGTMDKSKRNLTVVSPNSTVAITNTAGSINGEVTGTVTASGVENWFTVKTLRPLFYENWTLELIVSYSSFAGGDCRIAVIGNEVAGYPLYFQLNSSGAGYVSPSSGTYGSLSSALALNTKHRVTITKNGGNFWCWVNGVYQNMYAGSLRTTGPGSDVILAGSNSIGSTWTIDDARMTLGTRHSYLVEDHLTAFPIQ